MYGSLDIKHDRQNFFVILGYFLPSTSTKNPENKDFEKMKKNHWRDYHFKYEYYKWKSYDERFLRYGARQKIFSHFGPFFAPSHTPPSFP